MITISLGGCPQQQIPDQGQLTDDTQTEPPPPSNQREPRPIPPPPLDDPDEGDGTGGSSGTPDRPTEPGDVSQPIAVSINSPAGADINILPGQEAAIDYEVFGGSPADGAISVGLFYDRDGIANTGDEETLMSNLPPRGFQLFTANLEPGVYYLGLRAANLAESQTEYADGRLVIVGLPTVQLVLPAADQRVRPGISVPVQFTIDSLATTVRYEVFTDTDNVENGNEADAFSGGGLSASGSISTEGFAAGVYYIGVWISDSTGQELTEYFRGPDGNLRSITVDLAPSINVQTPATSVTVREGETVEVTLTASDPEGSATVRVFRDADGSFNGNEATFATLELTVPQQEFTAEFDTTGLPPATYRLGASITDGVSEEVASYAPGLVTIPGPPTVTVTITDLTPTEVRPPDPINLAFIVNDPERKLRGQTEGIRVWAFTDPDGDGQIPLDEDGAPVDLPVLDQAASEWAAGIENFYTLDTSELTDYLDEDGNGHFVLIVRALERSGNVLYANAGGIYLDSVEPTVELLEPAWTENPHLLEKDQTTDVALSTYDTSSATVVVRLDADTDPDNDPPPSIDPLVIVNQEVGNGTVEIDLTGENAFDLTGIPAGLYYVYVSITDGIGDANAYYAPWGSNPLDPNTLTRLRIRDREIGTRPAAGFDNYENGAILMGLNSGDLAGSSFYTMPDVNGDGINEFIFASRFGKAYNVALHPLGQGIGFGEGYMVYGNGTRLHGSQLISAVGAGAIPGLRFPGIRAALSDPAGNFSRPTLPATNGLSSITVVGDMDGDGLPELVFAFPRVESVSLATADSRVQEPLLFPDLPGMGSLEWDSWDAMSETWMGNTAQFTRGGIVIISSHNLNMQQPELLNRKSDRRIDLHEVGQLFGAMSRPSLEMYVRKVTPPAPPDPFEGCADCVPQFPLNCECVDTNGDPDDDCTSGCGDCGGIELNPYETPYQSVVVAWDVWLGGGSEIMHQGPGGFHQLWTNVPADPPLASPAIFTAQLPLSDDPCDAGPPFDPLECLIEHRWYQWTEETMCAVGIPGTVPDYACRGSWIVVPGMPSLSAWTGFYAKTAPVDYTIGARILGQVQNDLFGTMVDYDGTFLYVSAPRHTATSYDVPELLDDRPVSGVVYRLRTNLEGTSGGLERLQLWQEPGRVWPRPDAEHQTRYDYTMPTPHSYIIETVGSLRGNDPTHTEPNPAAVMPNQCYDPEEKEVASAELAYGYVPYPTSTSGYWVDRTPQIVGPHENAEIGLIRSLGDVDDDGNAEDFAVGCPNATSTLGYPGTVVGGIFVVYSYPDPDSNYLLERIASQGAGRIRGVWIKGSPGATMGRAFDRAGDFNGDGVDDVIVGSPDSGGAGEAFVLLGGRSLQSPAEGWTADQMIESGHVVRFIGGELGDKAGYNVTGAGDVDGDGYDDILISAPQAGGGAGKVYLIYGSPDFAPVYVETEPGVWEWQNRDFALADAGTVDFPSVVFTGEPGSELGGGRVTRDVYHTGTIAVYSNPLSALGDIDDDGLADIAMSAIKAQPNGLPDAGKIYIFYGRGDLEPLEP